MTPMMIRRLLVATFLIFASHAVQAATLTLDGVNSRKSSSFDGQPMVVDIRSLPRTWAWKFVVVQFNSYSGTPLDIEIGLDSTVRRFRGYTIQVALPDPTTSQTQLTVKNMGGSNSFDATWWVSPNQENSSVPVSGSGIPTEAIIAGQEGVPVTFSATSTPVVLYGRPSRPHNVLHVKFESVDGRPMTGMVVLGNAIVGLSGTTREFDVVPGAARSVTLGLQNPVGAPIRVTWTAVDMVPQTLAIPKKDSALRNGFTSRFDFSAVVGGPRDVVVRYDSATFPTGHGPSMTKYNVLPSSVPEDTSGSPLATWEIHGSIAPGKRAVAIMPIPVDLSAMPDSTIMKEIQIRHLVAATNQWESISIDSIRNGCMYFTTSSFSFFKAAWRITKRAVIGGVVGGLTLGPVGAIAGAVGYVFKDVVVDYGGDALGTGAAILGDVADTFKSGYKWLRNGICDYIVGPVINIASEQLISKWRWSSSASDPDAPVSGGQPVVRPEANLDRFFPETAPPSAPTNWKSIRDNPNWDPAIAKIAAEGQKPLIKIEPGWTEEERFDTAVSNVRMLLNDQILRSLDQSVPKKLGRFGFTQTSILDSLDRNNVRILPISDYLVFNFKWANLVARIGPLMKSCEASLNPADPIYKVGGHIKDMAKGIVSKNGGESACREIFGIAEEVIGMVTAQDLRDCISSAKHMKDWMRTQNWEEKKDKAYLGAVDYLTELDLLLWMNSTLRFQLAENMTAFVSQFAEYHDFIRILMEGNNIPIKGEMALGFHELLMGGTNPTRFRKAASFLSERLGPEGGFAEGTGYLEYVNQSVFPLLNVAVREGWVEKSVLPDNYFKSGSWLLSITGANGNRATLDDAINAKAFTAGYASFTDRPDDLDRFMAGSSAPSNAREILSLPAQDWSGMAIPWPLEAEFVDGVGILRGTGLDGKNWSMSIIAENDPLLKMGHGHDQQDNGTISLASDSDPGVAGVIVDPGYNGFENRKNTAYYEHHSVMMLEGLDKPVAHNSEVDVQDAWHLMDDLGSGFGHNPWTSPFGLLLDFAWVYNPNVGWQDHGGGIATLESVSNLLHFPGFRQVSILQVFDGSSLWSGFPGMVRPEFGRRVIMFAGGNFLVLDQAESRKPAPQYNYDVASQDLVDRFQAFGRREEAWTVHQDRTSTPFPQHGADTLHLGTISFHSSWSATSPGSVITFIPTNKAMPAHACTNSRDVYEACVEFTGIGGVIWTILANDYNSTRTLTYNDPYWGVAKTTDRYLVRQFNPKTMHTIYLGATGQNLNLDGTDLAVSTGLAISRDGWASSTGLNSRKRLHPRMSLPLIQRMLE